MTAFLGEEIATLDFVLVFEQALDLASLDREQRQKLKDCTPSPWGGNKTHGEL